MQILSQILSVFAQSRGDLVTFRGVHPAVEQSCECPDIYSVNNCTGVLDFCESDPCRNGGTCERTDGGYACLCPQHFAGRPTHPSLIYPQGALVETMWGPLGY